MYVDYDKYMEEANVSPRSEHQRAGPQSTYTATRQVSAPKTPVWLRENGPTSPVNGEKKREVERRVRGGES